MQQSDFLENVLKGRGERIGWNPYVTTTTHPLTLTLISLVITHALEWPTLTCQWFPDSDQNVQRMLIGTHTSEGAQNYVQIAQVSLFVDGLLLLLLLLVSGLLRVQEQDSNLW